MFSKSRSKKNFNSKRSLKYVDNKEIQSDSLRDLQYNI